MHSNVPSSPSCVFLAEAESSKVNPESGHLGSSIAQHSTAQFHSTTNYSFILFHVRPTYNHLHGVEER